MPLAAGIGESRKAFAQRRKKRCGDSGQDQSGGCQQETPGFPGFAHRPARRGSILNVLFEFACIDGARERWFPVWGGAGGDFGERGCQIPEHFIGAGIAALGLLGERAISDRLHGLWNHVERHRRLV